MIISDDFSASRARERDCNFLESSLNILELVRIGPFHKLADAYTHIRMVVFQNAQVLQQFIPEFFSVFIVISRLLSIFFKIQRAGNGKRSAAETDERMSRSVFSHIERGRTVSRKFTTPAPELKSINKNLSTNKLILIASGAILSSHKNNGGKHGNDKAENMGNNG